MSPLLPRNESDRPFSALVDLFKRLHDFCLVRASEESESKALDRGGASELGDCALRILVTGARQPHWVHGAHASAAEDHAGSHHTNRVCPVCMDLHASASQT